jgi:hypothetical protein
VDARALEKRSISSITSRNLCALTVIAAAGSRVGSAWSVVMVSLAVSSAVRHLGSRVELRGQESALVTRRVLCGSDCDEKILTTTDLHFKSDLRECASPNEGRLARSRYRGDKPLFSTIQTRRNETQNHHQHGERAVIQL